MSLCAGFSVEIDSGFVYWYLYTNLCTEVWTDFSWIECDVTGWYKLHCTIFMTAWWINICGENIVWFYRFLTKRIAVTIVYEVYYIENITMAVVAFLCMCVVYRISILIGLSIVLACVRWIIIKKPVHGFKVCIHWMLWIEFTNNHDHFSWLVNSCSIVRWNIDVRATIMHVAIIETEIVYTCTFIIPYHNCYDIFFFHFFFFSCAVWFSAVHNRVDLACVSTCFITLVCAFHIAVVRFELFVVYMFYFDLYLLKSAHWQLWSVCKLTYWCKYLVWRKRTVCLLQSESELNCVWTSKFFFFF
jgi:hypothetical protein